MTFVYGSQKSHRIFLGRAFKLFNRIEKPRFSALHISFSSFEIVFPFLGSFTSSGLYIIQVKQFEISSLCKRRPESSACSYKEGADKKCILPLYQTETYKKPKRL